MKFDAFRQSLDDSSPPPDLSPPLIAVWHDARGDWAAAHEVAQAVDDPDGSWVHAYLHRKEGDVPNAGYWYRRAGRATCKSTLAAEWEAIARALLGDQGGS